MKKEVKKSVEVKSADKIRQTIGIIIITGILTGTLDALAAYAMNYKAGLQVLFRYIAYGYFGKEAFTGGSDMILWGIAFHYLIAFAFTITFYLTYNWSVKIFENKFVVAFMYGIIAWFVMNFLVIPFSKFGMHKFQVLPTITGMVTLMICIGLPIALIADWRMRKTQ